MLLMLKSRLSRRRSPPARPPPLPKHQNSDSGQWWDLIIGSQYVNLIANM